MQDEILQSMENKDIVCQLDDPHGNLCTGFFAVRANELTLQLWQEVHKAIHIEHRDQYAFNRLIREMKAIRFGYLPAQFFGAGTFNAKSWHMGQRFYIPKFPIMFHANWTIGVDNKIALLQQARKIINKGAVAIALNNARTCCRYGMRGLRLAKALSRLA